MTPFDFTDPGMDAYSYGEAVADALGDDATEGYFRALIGELFELHPGIKERFVDAVLADLIEAVAQKEDSQFSHATTELINRIQADWRNDS